MSPPSTPLVKKRSGPSSFRMMGKQSPAAAGGHHPKPLAKVLREAPKIAKGGGQKWCPQQVAVTTSYDDDDMEVDGSDEENVAVTEHNFKH
jgi:hypothetical protein